MQRTCKIEFNDGTEVKFVFESQFDVFTEGTMLTESMGRSALAVEVDGKVLIYPTANIRLITLDPAPEKLPKSVIKGAAML